MLSENSLFYLCIPIKKYGKDNPGFKFHFIKYPVKIHFENVFGNDIS